MLSIDQIKALKVGDRVIDTADKRWKINGKNQRKLSIKIPVKHGLYDYGYITDDNLHLIARVE